MSNARTGSSFNWTKIHLVYFALAAFDLIAIATGLMLSEWSNAAHRQTVDKLAQVNFLREELKSKQNFITKLSGIGDVMATTGDMKVAQRDLAQAETSYAVVFSDRGFNERANEHFRIDGDAVLRGAIDDGGNLLKERLSLLDGSLLSRFSSFESGVKRSAKEMASEIRASVDASADMSFAESAQHASRADLIFNDIMNDAMAVSSALDWTMEKTVKASEETFRKSALLQYIVGGAIFVMILLACTYAHFMGRLLKSKYAELHKANADLADNLKRLNEAQDELIKKGRLEQLGQLTATVAHELRNPLGAVRTSAYLMERKLAGKNLGVEAQLLRITHGILRCDNIITQLLDFSRTKQLDTLPGDLDQWIEKLVCEEAGKLPSAVQVSCETGLGGRMVPFDSARLQRAVTNLLTNATEAMVGKGDDPAKFATAKPRITVSTHMAGDEAFITIADNGPGIAPENIEKVREPLFTTKSFGTGLGIPAIEQIAKQHGGTLEIESVLGEGARFTLRLPAPVFVEHKAA